MGAENLVSRQGMVLEAEKATGRITITYKDAWAAVENRVGKNSLLQPESEWIVGESDTHLWADWNVEEAGKKWGTCRVVLSQTAPIAAIWLELSPEQDSIPLEWGKFFLPEGKVLSGDTPVWEIQTAQLNRKLSLREGAALSGDWGTVAICGREVLYTPETNALWSDPQATDTGWSGFCPGYLTVLAFGDPEDRAEDLLPMARELYQEYLNEKVLPVNQVQGQRIRAVSGNLEAELEQRETGIGLTGVKGWNGFTAVDLPLFQLTIRDLKTEKEFLADSRTGWAWTKISSQNGGFRFSFAGWKDYEELAVEVLLSFPSSHKMAWNLEVLNGEQMVSVLQAVYPPLPFQGENTDCFIPQHSGREIPRITEHRFYKRGNYPEGDAWTMGFFAVYSEGEQGQQGIYFGLHDPDGALKYASVTTDPTSHQGVICASCPAPDYGKGGNAFVAPGSCVWALYRGGWYEAALLYRQFVRTESAWCPKVGAQGREDTPQWAKELSFWAMDWMPNTNPLSDPLPTSIRRDDGEPPADYWKEEALKLRKALGVPIGYHLYNWHWIPFNNDFPHFFPVKEGFAQGVRELEEQGVHVMPYINGRLWDTRDHEGEDREFTQKAFPWATKAENGSLYLEHYESHEPDGSYCQLASMCPSSGVWKKKMAYTLKRLFHEFGVSAVYIDQISAAPPVLCMDPSHHHLPGGGSWWTEQYNLLLRRCGQIKGEHGVITSESVAEVYAQSLDGLLTWVWVGDDLVPAFPVVYAGYLLMLGRNTNGLKKRDLAFFRYHAAQAFLFGQQMGWSNLDLAEDEEKLPFLRKLVRLRTKYAPYFYRGELLHPVSVSSNLSDTYTLPYVWETRLFQIKQVQGAMWRLWDQSGTLLFLANTSDQEATFTATLTGDFCQPVIEDGQVVLSAWEQEKNGITLSGTLSAQEMAVIRLEENKEFLSSCQ